MASRYADIFEQTVGTSGSTGEETTRTDTRANGATNTDFGNVGDIKDPKDTVGAAPIEGITKRRRGRQPYPRDEEGRIIRPDGTKGPKTYPKNNKENVAVEFQLNDRKYVRDNIESIFAMWAMFAKQPPLALSPQEAELETTNLCNLLDHLHINFTKATGGAGYGVALVMSTFLIMKPRIDYLRTQRSNRVASAAAEPQEAAFSMGMKPMDFTSDVQGNA